MKFLNLCIGVFLAVAGSLSAVELKNELTLVGGYQHGRFKQNSKFVFAANPDYPTGSGTPDVAEARLDLGIVGVDGRCVMPPIDCLCAYPYLTNFYLSGHAIWGFAGNNPFTETFPFYEPTGIPVPKSYEAEGLSVKGKLKNAQTYDFEIGLGYLIDFNQICYLTDHFKGWALGVEGGYSFHKQAMKTKNGDYGTFVTLTTIATYNADYSAYQGTKYHNKWNGGYIGGQLFYETCDWDVAFRYQYHIVEFRGINNTSAAGLASDMFADTSSRSNNAHGNVWTAKASYDVWCGLNLGVIFNYEYWHAKGGSWRTTAPAIAQLLGKSSVSASWNAWSIAGTLGYDF